MTEWRPRDGLITGGFATRSLKDRLNADGTGLTMSGGVGEGNTHTYTVKGKPGDVDRALKDHSEFAASVWKNLDDRFPDLESMKRLDVFNPSEVPEDVDKRRTYGEKQIEELGGIYGQQIVKGGKTHPAIVNTTEIKIEWSKLKQKMYFKKMLGHGKEKNLELFEKLLLEEGFEPEFPCCAFLIKVKLSMWLQTADAERGFSIRQHFVTDQRASMGMPLLQASMMVGINGPELDDKEGIMKIVGGALPLWLQDRTRYPDRSSAKLARQAQKAYDSQTNTPLTHVIQWAQVEHNVGGCDFDEEERNGWGLPDVGEKSLEQIEQEEKEREAAERVEEEEEEKRMNDALDAITIEQLDVPPGMKVLQALPLDVPFPGVPNLCKTTTKYLRDGKKKKSELGLDVAFKFEGGWQTGKIFMQETSKRNLGFFSIKVPGSQGYTLYDLKMETYSTRWVILVKVE